MRAEKKNASESTNENGNTKENQNPDANEIETANEKNRVKTMRKRIAVPTPRHRLQLAINSRSAKTQKKTANIRANMCALNLFIVFFFYPSALWHTIRADSSREGDTISVAANYLTKIIHRRE